CARRPGTNLGVAVRRIGLATFWRSVANLFQYSSRFRLGRRGRRAGRVLEVVLNSNTAPPIATAIITMINTNIMNAKTHVIAARGVLPEPVEPDGPDGKGEFIFRFMF